MSKSATRPSVLDEIRDRVRFVNRERWFRYVVSRRKTAIGQGFFDSYPRFFESSTTGPTRNRLQQRFRALIESNANIITGRRILDIASHDGRWSFAAHKAGASYVMGIEARAHLVEAAQTNIREYGISDEKVEFIQGDVLSELDRLGDIQFDTVFCFGFLYHTIDHMPLLRKIARLKPRNLIIDTAVALGDANTIDVREENIDQESAGAVGELGHPTKTIKGVPTKSALEMMLRATGFGKVRYYDWFHAGIERWDDLHDYYVGIRTTLTSESELAAEHVLPVAAAATDDSAPQAHSLVRPA